jgi:hypothetical protein
MVWPREAGRFCSKFQAKKIDDLKLNLPKVNGYDDRQTSPCDQVL